MESWRGRALTNNGGTPLDLPLPLLLLFRRTLPREAVREKIKLGRAGRGFQVKIEAIVEEVRGGGEEDDEEKSKRVKEVWKERRGAKSADTTAPAFATGRSVSPHEESV